MNEEVKTTAAPAVAKADAPKPVVAADSSKAPQAEAPVEEQSAEEPVSTGDKIDQAFADWTRSISNSAISRHTATWNKLQDKLPVLKEMILKAVEA